MKALWQLEQLSLKKPSAKPLQVSVLVQVKPVVPLVPLAESAGGLAGGGLVHRRTAGANEQQREDEEPLHALRMRQGPRQRATHGKCESAERRIGRN